uniref:Uncharacterized protein n=1 Tax=Trichogramma kaykai TaxID=54128 RepID=A0ABD2WDR4_9HYME
MSDDEMTVESSQDNDNVTNCNNDIVDSHKNDSETVRTIPEDEQSTSDNIADGCSTTEKTHEYVEVPYLEKNNKQNNTKSTFWNPNNLNDLMSSSQFTEIINTPASVTHGELFFLLLKFSVSNHLPTSAFHNLLNLVNTFHESPVLHSSKYINDKILNTTSEVQFHAVCSKCSIYLGEFGKDILPDKCNFCNTEVNLKQSSNDSFFALINPASQIRDLLEVHEDHYENIMKNRVPHHELIEDVYDGRLYQKFRAQLPLDTKQSFVTMVMNTDGAPKFKSSKKSIWPVYPMINELPKEKRLNDVICCALWFNKKKENMSVFLHKFVEVFNDISKNDAPVRASVTGMKQYNGHYLHCCLEGVAARMMGYFMKNLSDKDLENLDNKMLKIRASDQLQRLTRPISCRNDWKTRENFILYYSIPILEPLLSDKKFDHWLILVEGLYVILQEEIEIQNLNKANELFHRFVADMDENHGKRAMT